MLGGFVEQFTKQILVNSLTLSSKCCVMLNRGMVAIKTAPS
jgi:hypothetical protein